MIFKKGENVVFTDSSKATVVEELGSGKQGVVYKVKYNNDFYALKMYKSSFLKNLKARHKDKKFYLNLADNVSRQTVSPNFIWPLRLTETFDDGTYGYLMELIPANYTSFMKILANPSKLKANYFFSIVTKASINVVDTLRKLFINGLSFQDFNDGSLYINQDNGDIKICDCDNIGPNNKEAFILGKYQYMAPEIALGQKLPNRRSDQFSLSVILFTMFFLTRPFDGKAYRSEIPSESVNIKYFGENPVYICNPNDHSNGPVRGIHRALISLYPKYPDYLKQAFLKEYTQGLKNENARLQEDEWLFILTRLESDIIKCPYCKEEMFVKDLSQDVCQCEECKKTFTRPTMLYANENEHLYGEFGRKLYRWQVDNSRLFSNSSLDVLGEVTASKKNPNIKILKNLSRDTWILNYQGEDKEISPDKNLPLIRGQYVTINNKKFTIK